MSDAFEAGGGRRISAAETQDRIAERGPEAFDMSGSWTDAAPFLRSVPQWAGEAGAVLRADDNTVVVWLAPKPGKQEAFPSVLVLDGRRIAQERYAVSTWDTGKKGVTGNEICSGSPVIAGPPFDGAPLILRIRSIGLKRSSDDTR